MRIFDLALKNIGPFDEEYIKLRDDVVEGSSVTMITGMNGSGKSIIIDAIRSLLLGIYSDKIERNIVRDVNNFYIKALIFDGNTKTRLQCDDFIENRGLSTNNHDLNSQIYNDSSQKPSWILDYWSSFINKDTYKISSIQSIDPKLYLKNSLIGNKPNADIVKLVTFFDYLKGSNEKDEKDLGEYLYNTISVLKTKIKVL